jgi:hypothetical protein
MVDETEMCGDRDERRSSGIFCFTLLLTSGSPGLLLCEWRSSRAAGHHWHRHVAWASRAWMVGLGGRPRAGPDQVRGVRLPRTAPPRVQLPM